MTFLLKLPSFFIVFAPTSFIFKTTPTSCILKTKFLLPGKANLLVFLKLWHLQREK